MARPLHISILFNVAFASLASALVPADPTITAPAILPRQNNDRFIGYVSTNGSWYSQTCDAGATWYQDTKYAQCCPTTLASCYAATACVSGNLIFPYSSLGTTRTIACTSNYNNTVYSICNTAFIFENASDSAPKTDIVCGDESVNWSYYRALPTSATQTPTKGVSLIPQASASGSGGGGGGGGGSKAWIAGAVVGPILGLALIGALIFFCLRRRKNKHTAPQQGGAAMAPAGSTQYTDAKPQLTQQQQPLGSDPYANQGAYATQQGYTGAPVQASPQYNANPVPYTAPGSPPPQQNHYGNDVKHEHSGAPLNGAAELGGGTSGIAPAASPPATHHTAELGGYPRQDGAGLFGPSELPSPIHNGPTA